MYRVSPFTYLISGMLSTAVANTEVICASNEFVHFDPVNGTCGEYMADYITAFGGYLSNPDATSACSFCTESSTNTFLASVTANFHDAWRNFGIMWAFIIFNAFGALFLYWLVRVPRNKKMEETVDNKETIQVQPAQPVQDPLQSKE